MNESPASLKKRIRVLKELLKYTGDLGEMRDSAYATLVSKYKILAEELRELKNREPVRPWWKKLLGLR